MINFTEAQKEFRRKVQDFGRKELAHGAKERGKLNYITPEVVRKLADVGLLGLTTPAKFGGNPADSVTIGIMVEEISAIDSSPLLLLLNHVMIPLFTEWVSEEIKEKWLPSFARGERLSCFGNTEPDCGSDSSAIKTRAIREGDSYVIIGEKTSISLGLQADAIVLSAKTEGGARGITLFFVPLNLPGITRSPFVDMGVLPTGRASIIFDEVRVPIEFRIGGEGEGFIKVMKGFDFSRALAGLGGVGMARASLTEAIEYAKQRTAFGNPIYKFEGVSFKLAEDATLLEAARLLCYEALKLRDEGIPHTKEMAMAKWFAAKCAVHIIHNSLLIFGWRGYSEAESVEQRLRDAIGLQIGDGTAEIMKLIIAQEIFGRKFKPTM